MAGTAPTSARALRVPARGRLPAQGLLPATVAALVAYLTLLPLIFLLYGTFFTPTVGGVAGTFTLQNYVRAYTDRSAAGILLDSLTFAVGAALEEAAVMSGGGVLQTLYHVTLKLNVPAILGAFLILFLRGLETFEVPAIIGLPAGIRVLTSKIYLAVKGYPSDFGLAGAYSPML